ncbi:MAG TPA: response regulator [Polyangiaceae bacterium]|nr:response regulator [Polyangiaceae bacterium]
MTTKKVLVMDDSELVLDTVKEALETSGFSVVTAKDLTQLEERCSRGVPDLFVLDVQMPEMFGDDVGQVLRDVRKMKVPIVLFSSMDESTLAERVRDGGLDGCVSKSAGLGALVTCVESLLGTPRAS